MNGWEVFVEFLDIVCWPVVFIIFFLVFREAINKILDRISELELFGIKSKFYRWGESTIDDNEPLDQSVQLKTVQLKSTAHAIKTTTDDAELTFQNGVDPYRWDRSGDLYYVGTTLMYTVDLLLRGAPKETVLYGINRSLGHLYKLGLDKTPAYSSLEKHKLGVHLVPDKQLNTGKRDLYAMGIKDVLNSVGTLAAKNQDDFEPYFEVPL